MVLASETINTDKWKQLPNLTGWRGRGVSITYQASSELEDSHTEKPETHPEGQDRRSQDTAAIAPGLTRGQESRQKCTQLVTSLEMLLGIFFPDSLLVLMWPPSPPPTRTGQAVVDAGDT